MFYFCNGSVDCGSDRCPLGWSPQISSKVAGSNQSFHHKFKDLELIGLIAMVSVIITPQGSVALVWSCPHWRGPFEVGEIADEGQEPIICNVESNELGGGDLSSSRAARLGASGSFLDCVSVRTDPWRSA